jgi:hypothetical protein
LKPISFQTGGYVQRHRDALAINDGACNPIAIVNAMRRAVAEIQAEPHNDTEAICNDPALRLMTMQLAFLQKIPTPVSMDQYGLWIRHCEDRQNA